MDPKKLAVFGVGRVGLPLALVFAQKGFEVTGIDVDPYRISLIKHKIMPFMEEGAQSLLTKYYGNGFEIYSQEHTNRVISENQTLVFTLGTPIDETYSPNFEDIEKLMIRIAPFLKEGHLIILRSTISPGSTEQISRRLEELTKLKIGQDLFLAYCPERIAEGKSVDEISQIPQIIGSTNEASSKKAAEIFKSIAPKILFASPRAAELSKLYCNMYRYIDFAIGNEFMMIAEDYGCDIYEVLNLVNNDYKRAGLKSPGFTAGPCLVKDGFFLIDKSPYMELVTAAWRMNENIPGYLLKRIKEKVPNLHRKKAAILGLAFKKNIDDTRYSLSPKLVKYLTAEGAIVSTHDPYVDSQHLMEATRGADVVVIGVDHDKFKEMDIKELLDNISADCLFIDLWNLFGTGKIVYKAADLRKFTEEKKNTGLSKKNKDNDLNERDVAVT